MLDEIHGELVDGKLKCGPLRLSCWASKEALSLPGERAWPADLGLSVHGSKLQASLMVFRSVEERGLFFRIRKASDQGVAKKVLGAMSGEDFAQAMASGDRKSILGINGIGLAALQKLFTGFKDMKSSSNPLEAAVKLIQEGPG